jgi:hypothetical protein
MNGTNLHIPCTLLDNVLMFQSNEKNISYQVVSVRQHLQQLAHQEGPDRRLLVIVLQ